MRGIIPSLNTPFNADGAIDHVSLRRLINHTVNAGCGGMLGLAVAGEHSTLNQDEKARFVETVVATNAGRIPFIVSVTASEMNESVALTKLAKSVNAAGICVQLPAHFDRLQNKEFLENIAAQAPDLLMVQDLDWVGDGLLIDDILYLYERIEQFSWLKIETQRAGPKYSAILEATKGNLQVCGGWAVTQLMDAMARGVHAFIPTGMEYVYVAIQALYENGNKDAARALFERVLPILNFSNQDIGTSILFFKQLRAAEGLFETSLCRAADAKFDAIQTLEAHIALNSALDMIRSHTPGD